MKTQQLEKRTAKTTARQLADLAARLWPGPLPTWQKPTREKVLNDLPAWVIAIVVYILANYLFLAATAHAQGTTPTTAPTTTGPSVAGFFSQLFTSIGAIALLAAIAGYLRPQMFRFLFKEKATKSIVAGSFAALMLLFGGIGSSLEPKPVVTPAETAAKSAQQKAQEMTRVAEAKAAAAEARAAKAEAQAKAATEVKKASNEKADSAKTTKVEKVKGNMNRPHSQSGGEERPDDGNNDPSNDGSNDNSATSGTENTGGEELPANVYIDDLKGIGKREVGVVDKVAYTIINIESTPSIGDTQADGTFVIVHLAAANTDKKTHDVTTAIMKLLDDQDREFDPSSGGGMAQVMAGDQNAQPFSAQVQPGVAKKLTLVYDVPSDAQGFRLKIPAGTFSFDPDAVIRAPK